MSNDFIEEEFSGELEEITEAPLPETITEESAMPMIARIGYRQREIAKAKALRNKWIEQANHWYRAKESKLMNGINYYHLALEGFMRALNASNPNIKTLNLPAGKLILRKLPNTVELKEGITLGHTTNFTVEKTTFSLDKKSVKAHIKETGEIPDFVEYKEGETKFSIEVNDA
jgi:hypothetical protein